MLMMVSCYSSSDTALATLIFFTVKSPENLEEEEQGKEGARWVGVV